MGAFLNALGDNKADVSNWKRKNMKQVIKLEKPEPFSPKFEVSGCYCCFEDKYLFLRYADKGDFGGL